VRFETLDRAGLSRLEALWLELHAHHQAVSPELGPFVSDGASWAVRRELYDEVLAAGGFAFVACDGEADVGYALAGAEPAHWPATFATASEYAELHTLAVRADQRGRGLGTALMDLVDARLDELGLDDRMIGVLPANTRAVALYERRGYVPTWLTLTRFGRRHEVPTDEARVAIEPVALGEINALEPLWHSLHEHHRAVAPALAPFVERAASWEVMRRMLDATIRAGAVLRAGPLERPLGMACVTISRDDPLWADTWTTGRDVAEVKLLVVEESARGAGIGSALLATVDRRLAEAGVHDQAIGAIAPNAGAIRLYERRGFRPAWLQMTRFPGRR
jgi:ribosomal protein S18 acetylase RimI-like enzyme